MDFPGRAVVQRLMRSIVAVKLEILRQPFVTIVSRRVLLQVNLFVLDASPKSFDEYVVNRPTFAIHAHFNRVRQQPVHVTAARELSTLIGVEDLRPTVIKGGIGRCLLGRPKQEPTPSEKSSALQTVRQAGPSGLPEKTVEKTCSTSILAHSRVSIHCMSLVECSRSF